MKLPGLTSPTVSSANSEMPQDNIQLLLQRKAELAKSKAKFTLTERDGSLLVTHATELLFADGQVIVEAGHDISSVYRVKSGKVQIIRNGKPCCVLTQGYFIGESLLLYDNKSTYRMNTSLIACGPVVLLQLDLNFVKKLFALDVPLAMKFYRLIASKSASVFHQIVNNLHTSALLSSSLDSLNDSGLSSSTSSLSDTSSDTSEPTAASVPPPVLTAPTPLPRITPVCGGSTTALKRPRSFRLSRGITDAYKVYPLLGSKHGIQTCRVKPRKIKIVTRSFGFTHKVSIEFTKLKSITKIGETAVTIIHQERKFNTIFFKSPHDLEEFMYLVSSLTITTANQPTPQISSQPISTPPSDDDVEEEDPQVTKGEEHFRNIQVSVELKKGDKVFEEGDLYQRVYTLISGSLAVYQKGTFLHYLSDGHVFGVDSILYLRPCPVTIEVASDTATLLVIPAYRLHELIDSDIGVALKLFQRCGQIIDAQITKTLQLEQQLQSSSSSGNLSRTLSSTSLAAYRRSPEEFQTAKEISAAQQVPPLLQLTVAAAGSSMD